MEATDVPKGWTVTTLPRNLAKLDLYIKGIGISSFRDVVMMLDDEDTLGFTFLETGDSRKHYGTFRKDEIVGVLKCPLEPLED